MTREANQPRLISVRVLPRNVYAGQGTQLVINAINEQEGLQAGTLVEIISESQGVVYQQEFTSAFPSGVSELLRLRLDTKSWKGSYQVRVSLKDGKGHPITANQTGFDVFQPEQTDPPAAKISVVDPAGSLISFLDASGMAYTLFVPDQDLSLPVIIGTSMKENGDYIEQVEAAKEFTMNGGFTVFLDVPGEAFPWFNHKLRDTGIEALPWQAQLLNSLGLWAGRPHIVKKHPVFEVLPSDMIMVGPYENIHPSVSMVRQEGEYICGVVTHDHFPHIDKMRRHYAGPGDVWWAADVLLALTGKGKMLLSTLKIIENLGRDPVADKVFFNMVRLAADSQAKK